MKNYVLKAGAIILSKEDRRNIALLYRGKQGDWTFPKGHVDGGEVPEEAVAREVLEETGLSVKIILELPDHIYENETEGKVVVKMYLVSSLDDLQMKLEFPTDDIQWIPYNEVAGKLTYENLSEYFKSVLPIVKRYL